MALAPNFEMLRSGFATPPYLAPRRFANTVEYVETAPAVLEYAPPAPVVELVQSPVPSVVSLPQFAQVPQYLQPLSYAPVMQSAPILQPMRQVGQSEPFLQYREELCAKPIYINETAYHYVETQTYNTLGQPMTKFVLVEGAIDETGAIEETKSEAIPTPPSPKPKPKAKYAIRKEGLVEKVENKISDAVHKVEDAVMNKVHAVEDAVMDKVHGVENAVSGAAHKVADSVKGLFGGIGSLFHRGSKSAESEAGPGGTQIGKGSSVEVQQEGSSETKKGHVVSERTSAGQYAVQFHTDARGDITLVNESLLSHVTSYHPDVGSGVEVLHESNWYTGHIIAMPSDATGGQWKVQCHDDLEGTVTLANDDTIRPLLSDEEKAIVKSQLAKDKQEHEGSSKKVAFRQKLTDNGLAEFYAGFVEHGYDDETHLEHITDEELQAIGMKKGHIGKFYQVFPLGPTYIVYNDELKSDAAGLGYRASKDMSGDVKTVAPWGSKVQGVDQGDGWLKVGSRYLPLKMEGKAVLYAESSGPPTMLGKAEEAVEGALHGVANFLHLGSSKPAPGDSSPKGNRSPKSGGKTPDASEPHSMLGKAEEAVGGLFGGMFHRGAAKSDKSPSVQSPKESGSPKLSGSSPKATAPESSAQKVADSSPPSVEPPKQSVIEKAEGAASSALHGFAHLLHMDSGGSTAKSATKSTDKVTKEVESDPPSPASTEKAEPDPIFSASETQQGSDQKEAESSPQESTVHKAESYIGGMMHGFAHRMHLA